MASINKVASHLDAAHQQIAVLRERESDAVVATLNHLHAALVELTAIVRSDRV